MERAADFLLRDFIEEAREVLARMERRGLLSRVRNLKERCEETELCLHTLKGNAAAFGVSGFAGAASAVLDRVKAARESDEIEWLNGEGRGILAEFVNRAKDCLDEMKKRKVPPEGLFDALLRRLDNQSRNRDQYPDVGARRETKDREIAASVEQEVLRMLAGAPDVAPRIQEIVALARRELERERAGISSGFCPDVGMVGGRVPDVREGGRTGIAPPTADPGTPIPEEKVAATAGGVPGTRKRDRAEEATAETQSRAEEARPAPGSKRRARGYAVEARRLRQELESLLGEGAEGRDHHTTLLRLAEFLDAFAAGFDATLPLATRVVGREGRGWRLLCDALGADPAVDLGDPELRLLPALWDLLCGLVSDAYLTAGGGAGEGAEARLRLERTEAGWRVTIGGLPRLSRTTQRLKVFPLKRWVEELGGALVQRRSEIAVELPDRFEVVDTLRVRAGEADVGFPAHRVVGVVDFASPSAGPRLSADGSGFVLFEDERVELVDLTGQGRLDAVEEGGCAVILQNGKGLQAVKVNEVMGRSRMLVEASSEEDGGDGVLGFCLEEKQRSRFPLLFSALG